MRGAVARAAAIVLALGAVALGLAWMQGLWRLPERHDPWAPLSIDEAPGWTTRWRLARLDRDPALCLRVLGEAPWRATPLPDRAGGDGCGWRNAVRIDAMRWRLASPLTLSCPAAVSLALWERHVAMPAAQRRLGAPIARLDHFGSYACRNVGHRAQGERSRHASANAVDVAGFVLGDGRRIRVVADWAGDAAEAAFLRDLHRGACRWFDVVLGPEHDAAHRDHLHLDRGGGRACR